MCCIQEQTHFRSLSFPVFLHDIVFEVGSCSSTPFHMYGL